MTAKSQPNLSDAEVDQWTAAARQAAVAKTQIAARRKLARFTTKTMARAGEELFAIGHMIGPDRAAGQSPGGHGSDEIVAISLLLRISGQLTSASRREAMLAQYQAWKRVDELVCLPP